MSGIADLDPLWASTKREPEPRTPERHVAHPGRPQRRNSTDTPASPISDPATRYLGSGADEIQGLVRTMARRVREARQAYRAAIALTCLPLTLKTSPAASTRC